MKPVTIDRAAVRLDEAARRLGVAEDSVHFLGACGVLEKTKAGIGLESLDRFAAETARSVGKGEPLAAGVERVVIALRSEWDRALVARGPEHPRRAFGAVALGEHPDGTLVFAVEEALDRIVARNLHVLGGGRVRQLIVDRSLMERWGAGRDLLDEVPATVLALVPRELAHRHQLLPVEVRGAVLILAVAEALDAIALDDLRFQLGLELEFVIVPRDSLRAAIERHYGASDPDEVLSVMADLTAAHISIREDDLDRLLSSDEAVVETARLALESETPKPAPAKAPEPVNPRAFGFHAAPAPEPRPDYSDFDAVRSELGVDEEELKKLVSRGELRGYRDGLGVVFKTEEVQALKESERAAGKSDSGEDVIPDDSSDELLLDDSALGKDSPADDSTEGAPIQNRRSATTPPAEKLERFAESDEIVFDRSEEPYTIAPLDLSAASAMPSVVAPEPEAGSGEPWGSGGGAFGAPAQDPFSVADDEDTGALPTTLARARTGSPPGSGAYRGAAAAPPPMARPAGAAMSLGGLFSSAPAPAKPATRAPQMAPPPPPPPPLAQSEMKLSAGKRLAAPPSNAPAPIPAPMPKEDDEPETFERKATVRYYSQMYARKNYPLLVVVSKRSIQKIVKQHVAQVEGKKSFKIRRGNPFVTVRPIVPGCLCVPQELTINVKPKVAEAKFWITPTAEGVLEEARVEVLYEGKVVSTIETPTRVTTQALAKVTGSAAFLTTTAGPFFEAFGVSVKKEGASFLADVLAHLAGGSLRYGLAGVLAFFALAFFLKRRPKAGPETEGFFDWGVEDVVEGDPLVKAVKAKLVVLGPEGRDVVDLINASTLVGSAQTAHVRVKGARSLADVACELRYDDAFFLRARSSGVRVDGEDVLEGTERKLGRDAVIELDSARVTLWLLDLRQDAALDERRDAILEGLVRARPSFEKELRALWKRTTGEPVRGALLEAMRDTYADPLGWRRVREALRI